MDLSTTRLAVIAIVGVIGNISCETGASCCVSVTGGKAENARLRLTSASFTRISTTDSLYVGFSATGVSVSVPTVSTFAGKLLHADKVNEINRIVILDWLSKRTH